MIGVNKLSLTIKAKALEGGVRHKLTVYASTPGSPNYTNTEYFLVNKPPYNGGCSIDPDTGTNVNTYNTFACRAVAIER